MRKGVREKGGGMTKRVREDGGMRRESGGKGRYEEEKEGRCMRKDNGRKEAWERLQKRREP